MDQRMMPNFCYCQAMLSWAALQPAEQPLPLDALILLPSVGKLWYYVDLNKCLPCLAKNEVTPGWCFVHSDLPSAATTTRSSQTVHVSAGPRHNRPVLHLHFLWPRLRTSAGGISLSRAKPHAGEWLSSHGRFMIFLSTSKPVCCIL